MHCIELLGRCLASRDPDRQVAEFHVRKAGLNGFAALGVPVTEALTRVRPGRGEHRPSVDLRKRSVWDAKDARRLHEAGAVPHDPVAPVPSGGDVNTSDGAILSDHDALAVTIRLAQA